MLHDMGICIGKQIQVYVEYFHRSRRWLGERATRAVMLKQGEVNRGSRSWLCRAVRCCSRACHNSTFGKISAIHPIPHRIGKCGLYPPGKINLAWCVCAYGRRAANRGTAGNAGTADVVATDIICCSGTPVVRLSSV